MIENLPMVLRAYAEREENPTKRALFLRAADQLEVEQDTRKALWNKLLEDKQNFLDAERYRWLRDGSWNVPQDVIAPAIVLCDGKMTTHVWLTGDHVDKSVDAWMAKDFKKKVSE